MIIRKQFKFEGSHIVRNCSSDYCKKNIHGHGYLVEVFLNARRLDRGMMVYDFGLMKGTVKDFIESFDHAHSIWNKESNEYIDFFKKHNDRYIIMPISPSAEGYAVLFLHWIDKILSSTKMNNGEDPGLCVHSVRVHETATGYAEAFMNEDGWMSDEYDLDNIIFSDGIKKDWTDPNMIDKIMADIHGLGLVFENPVVENQI